MSDQDPRANSPPSGPARVGYIQVLRDCPGYRLLFSARVISLLGDWFSLIATLALLREVVGSSAMAISGMLILRLLPLFLAGPLAGVVADRFSRKWVMLISDVVRVLLVLGMIAAPLTPWPVALIYVLITLQVAAAAFFEPARTAALPQLVPGHYLSAANALGAVAWSVMFTLGAALGGVVTDQLGWKSALIIDATTYAISALLVWRIRLPRRARRRARAADWQTVTGVRDFREGLRFLARRPGVATVLTAKIGWGLAGAVTLFLTLFGERDYAFAGRPDLGVALLYVARAVGTGVGPVLARRLVPQETPRTMRALIAVALIWPGIWYFVFSTVHHWALAAAVVTLAHFGGSILWVYSTVLLQRMVPDEFRGRVMSADLGLATLAISVSLWVYGAFAETPGADLRRLVQVLSFTLVVPAAWWWFAAGRWPVGIPSPGDHTPPGNPERENGA